MCILVWSGNFADGVVREEESRQKIEKTPEKWRMAKDDGGRRSDRQKT